MKSEIEIKDKLATLSGIDTTDMKERYQYGVEAWLRALRWVLGVKAGDKIP